MASQTCSGRAGLFQSIEENIRNLGMRKDGEQAQVNKLQREIDSKRDNEKEKRRLMEDSDVKIEELERQRQELLERRQRLSTELVSAEDGVKNLSSQKDGATTQVDKLERQIKKLAAGRKHSLERLMSDRRAALSSYLEELEDRLSRAIVLSQDKSEKIAFRERLESERHGDSEVAELYETWTELRGLLNMSKIRGVRERLQHQLEETKDQLERRYPGALTVETLPEVPEIEDLFFELGSEGITRIYLPVSVRTWRALGADEPYDGGSYALRVVWGIANALGIRGTSAKLRVSNHFVLMEIEEDVASKIRDVDTYMPLPDSGSVAFVLSNLPHEMREALSYEHFDN